MLPALVRSSSAWLSIRACAGQQVNQRIAQLSTHAADSSGAADAGSAGVDAAAAEALKEQLVQAVRAT